MLFKERLKKLRKDRGITQEELAYKVGIPSSTIRRYESSDEGMPQKERLEALADYFDCTVDYLMGRTKNHKQILSDGARLFWDAIFMEEDEAIKLLHNKITHNGKYVSDDAIRKILSHARFVLKEEENQNN